MNNFKVFENSWHFKFLSYLFILKNYTNFKSKFGDEWNTVYYKNYGYMPYNFCQYWRAVLLWPSIRFVVSHAMDLGVLIIAYNFLPIFFSSSESLIVPIIIVMVIATLFVMIMVTALFSYFKNYVKIKDHENQNSAQPSLFLTMYRSYKNKFCPSVSYVKKDKKNA